MNNLELSKWEVLIVEDEPDNREIASAVLEYHGAIVHAAEDGVKGLEVLKTLDPTFILLDLSMPNMDGWEMLRHIRANPATSHIMVIAVTAHAMTGIKELVLEAGFNGYISKPFRFDTFLQQIKDCLSSSAGK